MKSGRVTQSKSQLSKEKKKMKMEDSSKSNYGFWLEGFLGFLIFRPKQPKSTIETNLN